MNTDVEANPEILFRPVKRRKFQRRRPEDLDSQQETQVSSEDVSAPQSPQDDATAVQTAETLRRRRLQRPRKGGIEFSASSRSISDQSNLASLSAATAEDMESERLRTMCDRFTAHTGQTVDVDKHMMAYIESELAKRNRRGMPGDAPGLDTNNPREVDNALSASGLPEREPASLGKLHEIDLGQEAKLRNIARTEEATRRLNGDDNELFPERSSSNMPTRHRKRRTSQDIERDRLVEEVLRESKLDVYDEPEEEAAADGQAADDRVAEQFRRDFLDAIQSRRRVARTKTTVKQPGKTEAPKGPKLGGSRSARAAMREMQEKAGRK
ncbi:hepatocellular carcinoma-associated antigen 59-domain-containing protein [Aspergillus cavernicola]|uniref:Hepatocellular carcinoma-associated antigen 59-domain-containing protein n=1 Tax=Aspergillus cavernicola TaxID=176166 RepID=A0ABR4J098_9EURO